MAISVLVVDDDDDKRAEIAASILEAAGENAAITEVSSTAEAAQHLRKTYFDLLVLDIAVPRLNGEDPDMHGGLRLLDEITQRSGFNVPAHIVGITAYDEVLADASAHLGSELWTVIYYDRAATEWTEQLKRRIRHLLRAKVSAQAADDHEFDLCIVTALQAPELSAVLSLDWKWSRLERVGYATIYHRGEYMRSDGRLCSVVAAHSSGMGMSPAAALTMKMGLTFKPRLIAMPGICAGDSKQVQIGDVVAANPVWDYGSGKHVITADGEHFQPAPYPITLKTRVRGVVERLQQKSDLLVAIHDGFAGSKPNSTLNLRIGPFASGASVVANAKIINDIQQQQHRKLMAIDMEAYGVLSAATELPAQQPDFLIIKAVSDFANDKKNDDAQDYAAHVSARILAALCMNFDLV